MNLTEEQQAVVSTDLAASAALKVIAFAGAGKTSTLCEYARVRPMDQFAYIAFNKSVQSDAERRFPANVSCRTIHSLAFQAVGRKFNNIGNVPFFLITKMFGVDVYRATLIGRTLENWFNSADDSIEPKHVPEDTLGRFEKGFEPRIVEAADRLWDEMKQDDKVPMTHSGYLKLYQLSRPSLPFDTILLDEAQDTNPVTFDILRRQVENGARFLLVGDPYQQIYSWRGAQDAMQMVDCPTLHVTQSFRFGPAVASVANLLLGTFFKNEIPLRGFDVEDRIADTALVGQRTVICRTNAALFRQADDAAMRQTPLAVVGSSAFETYLDKLMDVFYLYSKQRDKIKERQVAFFRSYADLVRFSEDRLDAELGSRVAIVNDYRDQIPEAICRIRTATTAESAAEVLLTTGHKSKGLEFEQVVLADDFADLFDERGDTLSVGPDLPKDEINLLYVAATRAKKALQLNGELRRLAAKGQPVV